MIWDSFECTMVRPEDMDRLWSCGFRHFGTTFFRYNAGTHDNMLCDVIPLRINLRKFRHSQSQKRIERRNRDIEVKIAKATLDHEKQRLFDIHKMRFRENIPDSLHNFFSFYPARVPCEAIEFDLFDKDRLIGVGYLDLGKTSTSSVYTFFDPSYGRRSLGIYVILLEIRYSLDNGYNYLYPGYAYKQPSFYDYKKNFYGLEYFDWIKDWHQMERSYSAK